MSKPPIYIERIPITLRLTPQRETTFKMRLFLLLFYFICASFNISAASDITTKTVLTAFSLKPQIIDDELYSETFSLFADLDDGQYVYAQIGVTNIGPGDKKGLCRIMLSRPNEETINQSIIVDSDQWHYTNNPTDSLTVGHCQLTLNKNNRYVFTGNIDNTSIKISLNSNFIKPINIIAIANIHKDNGRYFAEVLIPWSSASASYIVATTDEVKALDPSPKLLNGFGYADHSISTLLPDSIASKIVRFRGINSHNSHLLLSQFTDQNKTPVTWLWRQQKSLKYVKLISENTTDIKKNKMPSFTYRENLADSTHSKSPAKYTFYAKELIYRHAPLEEKGLLGKILSKIIGNPVTYTYRATISTHFDNDNSLNTSKPITGILEVSYANE